MFENISTSYHQALQMIKKIKNGISIMLNKMPFVWALASFGP